MTSVTVQTLPKLKAFKKVKSSDIQELQKPRLSFKSIVDIFKNFFLVGGDFV